MSKYVIEIIKDIKSNPNSWNRYGDNGLKKDDVIIKDCGNGHKYFFGWATSVVSIIINEKDTWTTLTWFDKYKIEEAFKWWMKNASLDMIKK